MKLKAAIFDLDGTILNSLNDLHLTMNRVLKLSGYPEITLETVTHLIGYGAKEFMRLSLPEHARDKETLDKNLLTYLELYNNFGMDNTVIYDGMEKVFDKLIANNIKIGVLSNKPHIATIKTIEKFLPQYNFNVILGQKDIFPPKPDTTSSLYLAKELGENPSDIAFIGDAETDVKAANNGGFFPITVLWGYRSKQELEAAGGKNFVNKPEEILKYFNLI